MVQATRNFLCNRMKVDGDLVAAMQILSACFSGEDMLCVKFASRDDIFTINRHRMNQEDKDRVEEFIPPALQDLENALIRKGYEIRATKSATGFLTTYL